MTFKILNEKLKESSTSQTPLSNMVKELKTTHINFSQDTEERRKYLDKLGMLGSAGLPTLSKRRRDIYDVMDSNKGVIIDALVDYVVKILDIYHEQKMKK